jgi:hypothetical protein
LERPFEVLHPANHSAAAATVSPRAIPVNMPTPCAVAGNGTPSKLGEDG